MLREVDEQDWKNSAFINSAKKVYQDPICVMLVSPSYSPPVYSDLRSTVLILHVVTQSVNPSVHQSCLTGVCAD